MYWEDFSRRGSWFKVTVPAVIMSQSVSFPGALFSTDAGLGKRQEGGYSGASGGESLRIKRLKGP